MRKLSVRLIFRFLIFALTLFCWYRALILSGDMVKTADTLSFRYGDDGIPSAAMERMLEEESVHFAVWLQKNDQTVGESESYRKANVQLLEVTGDAELVLSPEDLMYGFLPVRGSADTCAIDASTAYALCGSTAVTGETLLYDDREYIISGVFSQPENTMLIQGGLKENDVFPYLELSVSGLNVAFRQADEFLTRYSLSEPDMLINNMETAAILRQLALFPAFLAASLLLWKVLRRIFGNPTSALGRIGFAVSMVAGVLMSAWAIGVSPVIPVEAIPGRWSDFSFWSALVEDMTERARLSRTLAWPAPDLVRLQEQRFLLFYSAGAFAGLTTGLLFDRIRLLFSFTPSFI